MAADVSRVRFDPMRDLSGVGLQQGRLVLDAEWNEQAAVLDRRLRAAVVDLTPGVITGSGTARVSLMTPNAFKVAVPTGGLTVEPGRMYVDGLLAHNHGKDAYEGNPSQFGRVMAEAIGAGAVDYYKQPYWKAPETLPKQDTGLVYLKVWQRELTALQMPDLVEPAVGVDTTTRTQIAWQVRVLTKGLPSGLTCSSSFTEWDKLIAPSSARLSTGTVAVADKADPCELPPAGGYRGTENRLYRVELHTGGSAATFKWSRENASVAFAVVEWVSGNELRLSGLGKDAELGLHDGDWVEIVDDWRELDGGPGVMRKITLKPDTNAITFGTSIETDLMTKPTGVGEDTLEARHLRVIRWDQRGTVTYADGTSLTNVDTGTTGTIPVPTNGKAVLLEHGVTVTFSLASVGEPHAGDHWVFAARVAGATVEPLAKAPPRGIHYHYARLAVATFPSSTPTDCRLLPDAPAAGDGCCEVCVQPGGDIQAAVDKVKNAGGGTVTLCPGAYPLKAPISMKAAVSVWLRGTAGTQLVSDGAAIVIENAFNCAVERLAIKAGGDAPAVQVLGTTIGTRLEGLNIEASPPAPGAGRIGIGLFGQAVLITIRGCFITAPVGIGMASFDGLTAVYTTGLRIEENVLMAAQRGIDLSGGVGGLSLPTCIHTGPTRIAGNTVVGASQVGIAATGWVLRGPDVAWDSVLIVDGNDVTVEAGHGILTGGCVSVRNNAVTARSHVFGRHGIQLATPAGMPAVPGPAEVLGNRVTGFGGFGVTVETSVYGLLIKQNTATVCGGGIAVRAIGPVEQVSVDNNEVLGVVLATASAGEPTQPIPSADNPVLAGVWVSGARGVRVLGNAIGGIGTNGSTVLTRVGIAIVACGDVRVAANSVVGVGPATSGMEGSAIGIAVHAPADAVSIDQNSVGAGATVAATERERWRALVVASGLEGNGDGIASTTLLEGYGWVTFDGVWAYLQAEAAARLTASGNSLYGGGRLPAVDVKIDGDAVVIGNQCGQPTEKDAPAIELTARSAAVQGNRVRGGVPSIAVTISPPTPGTEGPTNAAVVLGNLTTGDIWVDTIRLKDTHKPWSELNTVVP